MKIKDSTYDFLKWFALVAIPGFEAFWLTVGKVWNFPYLTEIGTTIAAVGLLIAALIGASSQTYNKEQRIIAKEDTKENQLLMMENVLEEDEQRMVKGD